MWGWRTLADGCVAVDARDGRGPRVIVPRDPSSLDGVAVTWRERVAPHAASAGVPLSWVLSIITQESRGDAAAVSGAGAVGLMQVLPRTAGLPAEALLDWQTNVKAGVSLLRESRRLGYDLPASASRYNAGAEVNGVPHPAETSPWGMREQTGYISAVVAGSNRFLTSSSASGPAPSAPAGPAPACRRALADADARWPRRLRASDGIMGDAAHQRGTSDHNLGLAVDITHDPASGCRGELIAAPALQDPRTKYVIWARHIINPRDGRGWRPYTGANPHESHVHISILPEARDDVRPWGWSPSARRPAPSAGAASSALPLFLLLWRFVK